MIKIEGKFNTAVVYANEIEGSAAGSLKTLCDLEVYKDSKIRIMPDVHAGKGATIGTTMTLHGAVCPNAVGVDISCGMLVAKLREKKLDLNKLDKVMHQDIASGRNVNTGNRHRFVNNLRLEELRCFKHIKYDYALDSLMSLGSGNHFAECDTDDEGNLYIVIHSGSRHLGVEVAEYYQDLAFQQRTYGGELKKQRQAIIDHLKEIGHPEQIQHALQKFGEQNSDVSYMIAWCTGNVFDDYIHDMKIVEEFAYWNRQAMLDTIVKKMKLKVVDSFTSVHNYIDTENMILRKGSCSAQLGEKLIIPMNMRDGSLICVGKGNPEWNFSAPHGAGRIMSRSEAKETLSMSDFKKSMEGIFTTCVNRDTIDEAPMAYKPMEVIISQIGDTVEIQKIIKPIYNFKASDETPKWRKEKK